ncbi:PREDICTED: active regulator of SIRT1-like [Nicrophorus vespilloides]|uniref:Active regulator of SIRT1 n=1 Tax=Nicrophorus vespilloides TaxID=110193 RepID=A0ABM1MWQ1_NICVS|nr:PREDICTED: active regulator of SIRT1-like [Nicrophorus vespilloides]
MSAAIVRQSLALVDDTFNQLPGKVKKNKKVHDLMPDNQKLNRSIVRKGRKVGKVNLLQTEKKLTVSELKKTLKTKEQIKKENLEKLRLIRDTCRIELDESITSKILERAVRKRPLKSESRSKEPETTAFTEEDFKKFEEEYHDE